MMISHLAKSSDSMLPNELLKPVLTCLVNGTMEKNSMVKSCRFVSLYLNKSKRNKTIYPFSSSETALVDVLHMRKGPQGQQQVLCLFPIPRYPLLSSLPGPGGNGHRRSRLLGRRDLSLFDETCNTTRGQGDISDEPIIPNPCFNDVIPSPGDGP